MNQGNRSARTDDRLIGDQGGIALPLAMVMVMLIGVVGAGLLVFVVSDNSSAAQVNRGQQAFGMADAGVGIAENYLNEFDLPQDDTDRNFELPDSASIPAQTAEVTINRDGNEYRVLSRGRATAGAERRVETVLQANAPGGVTAPKNYYSGANFTLANQSNFTDGDILVEGRLDITNNFTLSGGDIFSKGYGNFTNLKEVTNGSYFLGGGAIFTNNTTVNNGGIYIDGGLGDIRNSTTVNGGGICIGDRANLTNDTKIVGGDLYSEGDARVGNLDVSGGGSILVGGLLTVDNGIKLTGGDLYVRGSGTNTSIIQNANISNSRIYINGPVEFRQTNTITNSEIYVAGNTRFTNSSNLTGTSLFVSGNVTIDSAMNLGTGTSARDLRYGNWRVMPNGSINQFNAIARGSNLGGIGATGTITGSTTSVARGTRSYDSATSPRFVATVSNPQPTNRIRFPFDPANPPGRTVFANAANKLEVAKADAIARIDAARLSDEYYDALRQKAIAQGNYREVPNGQQEIVVNPSQWQPEQKTWPANSEYKTVVYYRYPSYSDSNRVQWLVNVGCTNKVRKGILVVENGIFSSYNTGNGFNGTIVLRNGKFDVSGSYCMNGYVNTRNGFTGSNNSRFNFSDVPPLSELNDDSAATRLSWREVYE